MTDNPLGNINENIEKRANALLDSHIGILGADAACFVSTANGYERRDKDGNVDLYIGYAPKSKLLTKIFNLELRKVVKNDLFERSFSAKIKFRGSRKIESASFELIRPNSKIEEQLNDPEMLEEVTELAQKVDVSTLTLDYSKANEKLTIVLMPYAGAFLWIKFPPVFYPLKLTGEEMKCLCSIIDIIGEKFAVG